MRVIDQTIVYSHEITVLKNLTTSSKRISWQKISEEQRKNDYIPEFIVISPVDVAHSDGFRVRLRQILDGHFDVFDATLFAHMLRGEVAVAAWSV